MRVVWATRTRDDFLRIYNFLRPLNPDAATRAARTVRQKGAYLADDPEIGTLVEDETGRRQLYIPFGKNGYVLHYILDHEADRVVILRVWHSREDRGGIEVGA